MAEPNSNAQDIILVDNKKAQMWLSYSGMSVSIIYIVIMFMYTSDHFHEISGMNPDQFGTFLSGALSPLAFLWLVLGFFQQGRELRNSADSLHLQGRELQHSVEQQRQLVSVGKDQLKADRESRRAAEFEAERVAQNSLTTMQATLLRDFTKEFDSLIPIRYHVAKYVVDCASKTPSNKRKKYCTPPEVWRMMDFFDKLSMYVKREYLDTEMVFISFFYWLLPYWHYFSEDVKEMKDSAPLAMWDEIPLQLIRLEKVGRKLGITDRGMNISKSPEKILEFFSIELEECKL